MLAPSGELYFPFLDGSLGYDCVRCGSRCCHGSGFGVGRSQLVPLLLRRPALAPFVRASGAVATVLDLTDEGCWFLRGDGRCGIEVEDGRDAKPSVCRLFPFTRLHRIGEVTVVEPHLLLCPIEDRVGQGVTWREIEAELAVAGSEVSHLPTAPPAGLSDDWSARERAIVALCEEHLAARDPLALAAAQLPSSEARLLRLRAWWWRSLALDEAAARADEAELARPLALLTPAFRFASLFTVGKTPYPKALGRLPALLLATALFGGLARRALGRTPGLRSLGELFRATPFQRELLARWDRPVSCEGLRPVDLPPPLDGAWSLLAARLDGARPLGTAFDEAVADLPPPLRPLLLGALADRHGALRFG
ncbi:MAG: hypothetical protein EXR72_17705 [Myxococcales bacterium]|nr:hypothetical protein [Myxococcales bacterium]